MFSYNLSKFSKPLKHSSSNEEILFFDKSKRFRFVKFLKILASTIRISFLHRSL